METTMEELAPYLWGWRRDFGFCETAEVHGLNPLGPVATQSSYVAAVETPRRRGAALLELRPRLASNTYGSYLGNRYVAKAKVLPWGLLMRTSNRPDLYHCSRRVSITDPSRRVRTRMHGGLARVGG
jgi:hypothetical protein